MKKFILILLFNCSLTVLCQQGQLDLTFNHAVNSNLVVNSIAQQVDNKILIGGWSGSNSNNIFRLNEDGTFDSNFFTGNSFGAISSITIQSDNKILVTGGSPHFIKRLNPNGTLDTTFNFPGLFFNGWISQCEVLNDGRIIIGGNFQGIVNNNNIVSVARLNPDGSLDTSFNLNLPPSTSIRAMELQSDGKIIVAGQNDAMMTQYRIFRRFLPNGTIDANFIGDEDYYIYDIKAQSDGKIMISGTFSDYFGVTRYNVARLNNDGSLDASFDSYNFPQNGAVYTIFGVTPLNDGKYVVNGSFKYYDNQPSKYIAKINNDGTIDSDFDIGIGPDNTVWKTYVQNDGKILIGGSFTSFDNTTINSIARLGNKINLNQNDFDKEKIEVYPNPFKDKLNFRFDKINSNNIKVRIYSISGKLLRREDILEKKSINLDFLESGVYLLEIEDKKQIFTTRIVKI